MKKMRFLVLVLVFVAVAMLAGCAPYYSKVKMIKEFSGEAVFQKDVNVTITAGEGVEMSPEAINSMTEKLVVKFAEHGWTAKKETDLTVQISIVKYQEGNAIGRFLAGTILSSAVAAIVEGRVSILNKGTLVLETDVLARTSYIGWSFRSIEEVQDLFVEEVLAILGEKIK
jgi:hypothetical protein